MLLTEGGRIRLGWRILLFILLTVTGLAAVSLVVPSELPYGSLPLLVGSLVGGWALLALDGRSPGALGFYLGFGAAREAVLGLALGVLIAGVVVAGMVAVGALRWSADVGSLWEYISVGGDALWLFSLPAAGEEAAMRGYLIQALAEAVGGGWALWATSVLFGLLHFGNPDTSWIGLANIVVAGLFLGVVYLRTASLRWATGAHLGWNWAHGFLFDLPVSGLELVNTPAFEPVLGGPDWLSGGPFGPEGSVMATLVLSLTTLVLWNSSWLQPGKRAKETRPLHLTGEG
ncbi:MAG: CPBP family intramembrane metalloprotease [Gemmatimonadetes bacterium]|nr:CPBP family intramembrane metalloprotease [Gemmatimonadota bacterium]